MADFEEAARPRPVPPPEGWVDAGVPWHYGDPHAEQRRLAAGEGAVDLSHLAVVRVTGSDRLSWLHSLTTADLASLAAGESATALILDPHGHVEHELHVVDDGSATWLITEPATAPGLVDYLQRMRFMLDVDVQDVSGEYAVVWIPRREPDPAYPTWLVAAEYAGSGVTPAGSDRGGDASKYIAGRPDVLVGAEVIVPRSELDEYLAARAPLAGTWALEALRVAAAVPRWGFETDYKTLPHEVGWIGPAVHLAKGCYRGQETVARVHNMGRPPRRLVLLHLDGSAESLPEHGDEVMAGEKSVGWVASVARHYELGPVATAVIKRSAAVDTPVTVNGVAASVEPVIAS